jgi:hypothetical protein
VPGKHLCFVFALFACAAFAQTKSQTFYLTNADSPAIVQQSLNAIRSIGDIRDATSDWSKKSITVQGTTDQLSLAAWLTNEINHAPQTRPALMRHDYPGTVADNREVHIFYMAHTESPQDIQEVVNMVRSIADIQRMFPWNSMMAIVLSGTPEQSALAGWMLNEVDVAPGAAKSGMKSYPYSGDPRGGNVVQVYVLANTDTPKAIQEIVNGTRSVADIQRCFPFASRKLIGMRGSNDQIALADWILGLLDRPATAAPDSAMHEYRYNTGNPWDTGNVARVFFLNVQTPEQLQQAVNEVRSSAKIQRAFPNQFARAIAMRGTGDQISQAEQILKGR